MKHAKWIGVLAGVLVMVACYSPWVFFEPIQQTITGMNTSGTSYGKPAILSIGSSIIAIILFLIPFVWAKRTNIFVTAFNLAWNARNYIIITMCSGGDCPEKKYGIYLLLAGSILMLLMAFLPEGKLLKEKNEESV